MAAKHWLIGCGIGCGAILLVVVALVVGGGLLVKDTMDGFNAAVESREVIDERFGEVKEFTPWSDGAVPAARMEAFLAVREANAPAREKIAGVFSSLPMSEAEARELESQPFLEQMRSVFGIMGSAMGLAGHLGEFFEARNQALLEHEIGMGEYTYIYAVAYYAWLGHSPRDAPEHSEIDSSSGEIKIKRDDGFSAGLGGLRSERIREDLIEQLQNQLDGLPEGADEAWRETLTEEISRMEADRDRLLWQEALPAAIAASLEPYADRLEATYNPVSNPFELLRNRRSGKLSIQAE